MSFHSSRTVLVVLEQETRVKYGSSVLYRELECGARLVVHSLAPDAVDGELDTTRRQGYATSKRCLSHALHPFIAIDGLFVLVSCVPCLLAPAPSWVEHRLLVQYDTTTRAAYYRTNGQVSRDTSSSWPSPRETVLILWDKSS